MLIERTQIKRKEGILPKLGRFISVFALGLTYISEEMQYETEEKEIKEVKHE